MTYLYKNTNLNTQVESSVFVGHMKGFSVKLTDLDCDMIVGFIKAFPTFEDAKA